MVSKTQWMQERNVLQAAINTLRTQRDSLLAGGHDKLSSEKQNGAKHVTVYCLNASMSLFDQNGDIQAQPDGTYDFDCSTRKHEIKFYPEWASEQAAYRVQLDVVCNAPAVVRLNFKTKSVKRYTPERIQTFQLSAGFSRVVADFSENDYCDAVLIKLTKQRCVVKIVNLMVIRQQQGLAADLNVIKKAGG